MVRLQLVEHARALPLAITHNTGYRDLLAVVVQDRPRHPAKKGKGANVPVAEGVRRLRRIRRHKTRVRVRKIHRKEVDLAYFARERR
jgi:hypothetical protein